MTSSGLYRCTGIFYFKREGRFFTPPQTSSSLGLAHERLKLNVLSLPMRVIQTIQSTRVASWHSAYHQKWSIFEQWCEETCIVLFLCSVEDVFCFLQELLDKGRDFSMVYLAAISACHVGIHTNPMGQHPFKHSFSTADSIIGSVCGPERTFQAPF